MKILMLHNYYQIRGGEDVSAEAEVELLRNGGHDVDFRTVSNHDIASTNRLALARDTVWSSNSYRKIVDYLAYKSYDVLHVQNFFPQWSPSIFYAAKRMGVPTVFSVRNYRLLCLNGLFFRDAHPCEKCMGTRFLFPGILFRCYRANRMASLTVAMMLNAHRFLNTWKRKVDCFITLSDFSRQKMIQADFDPGSIMVKPNFVAPTADFVPPEFRRGVVYVGRLSSEKGVDALLDAWGAVQSSTDPLTVVGDGPLKDVVQLKARENPTIRVLGQQPLSTVHRLIASAKVLVQPSCCYETFGRALAEAFSYGTPVVASNIGAIGDLVLGSQAGITIPHSNHRDLAKAINRLLHDHDLWMRFHSDGLRYYKNYLTPTANLRQLCNIYQTVQSQSSIKAD